MMEKLLVLGGARAGKSTYAEGWAAAHPAGEVTYVATARRQAGDAEWDERIRRHRLRRPPAWETVETTDVAAVLRAAHGTVIVDCLALWLTAVLDDNGAWEDAGPAIPRVETAIDDLAAAWQASTADVVAVSNEVGSGVVPPTPAGRLFRDLLGVTNQRIAAASDRVVLCVAGRALDLPPASPPPSSPDRRPTPVARPTARATARVTVEPGVVAPVDVAAAARTRTMIDGLAKPVGSLGRVEELAEWLSGVQGVSPPRPPRQVAVTVFAGDHGVADETSAYPTSVTAAMVRTVAAGRAAVNALAAEHGAVVRVRDLGVDAVFGDLDADVAEHKVRRGTGRIDVEDAMSAEDTRAAIGAGRALALADISAGADLLIAGDLGIGNTTVAAALIGAALGLDAEKVTGRGTGIDDATLRRKTTLVAAALSRVAGPGGAADVHDAEALLTAVGGPDLAAMAGYLAAAAEHGVPVLLDGVVVTAAAVVADLITPGASAWWVAGHRSAEPAHGAALDRLHLEPIIDLRMRLGEGTGALVALPMLRSAVAVCTGMAALTDLDLT